MTIARTPRFLHDPYLDVHPEIVFEDCRVPDANRVPGERQRGDEGVVPRRAALHRGALLRRSGALPRPRARLRGRAGGVRVAHRRVPGRLVPAGRLAHRARRRALLTYHAAHAFDTLRRPARRAREGRDGEAVSRREMAGRVVDRAVQVFGGRGYMLENPVARHYRELRVDRIWEGTSEIQRLILSRGLVKRGAEAYL